MNIIRKQRILTGNVALTVIALFLFSFIFGAIGASVAFADTKTVNVSSSTSGGYASQIDVDIAQGAWQTIQLNGITVPNFQSVLFTFKVGGQEVGPKVYFSEVPNSVYGSAYYTYTAGEVYGKVYYSAINNDVYLRVYADYAGQLVLDSSVLTSVYLKLEVPPPPSSGGGGGGGGVTSPPAGTVQTNAGTITVDNNTNSAVLAVDTANATQAIAATGKFIVEIPATVTAASKVVALPQAVINAVKEKGATVEVRFPEVTISIPAAALAVAEIAGASSNAQINLAVNSVPASEVQAISDNMPAAAKAGLTTVATVIEFKLEVVEQGQSGVKVARFAQPLTVEIPYQATNGVDENKLGVYRLADNGQSWTYVGGKIDKASKKVSVNLNSFSKYTVMEFNKTFTDTASHWAKGDIELMASRHIAKGISDNEFAPNSQITRAQFAALLIRALGIAEAKPANAKFTDVAKDKWYFGAVEAAAEAGLVGGYADKTFKPDANITRQEMAAMVVRAMDYRQTKPELTASQVDGLINQFADASKVAPWAKESAAIAAKTGIINGRTADTYAPVANATRAEGIVMLKRLLTNLDEI